VRLGNFAAFTAVLQHLFFLRDGSVGHRKRLVATRFWSHEYQLPHPQFSNTPLVVRSYRRWGCVEAQHDQKEVTVTFKLSVEFLLPGGERQLDCRTLCALKCIVSYNCTRRERKERKWLIVEKGKERIRGVVIVYSVRNEEGKKRLKRRNYCTVCKIAPGGGTRRGVIQMIRIHRCGPMRGAAVRERKPFCLFRTLR